MKTIFFVISSKIRIGQSLRRIANQANGMTLQRLLLLFIFSYTIGITTVNAQLLKNKPTFTKADTLRGSLNENRDWWDVLRYDITVKPDFEKKEIEGKVILTFTHQKITKSNLLLQLDLQEPLIIDSIIHNNKSIEFTKNSTNTWLVNELNFSKNKILSKGKTIYIPDEKIEIYYHGKPKEAKTPPWDGGWIWKKDKNGNPWMSVAVQGLGASAWYPCKDYQGDEPDNGASLMMIVPDSLVAVSNGRLTTKQSTQNSQHQTTYSWEVKNPINSYCIVPYIGKYVNFTDTLMGEKGKLDLSFWVLDYNLEKAKEQFKQVKPMLRAFEYWFGPYPFYKDSYKLVDAPHLGMEHQSAVAYGNQYKNGYLGSDRSGKTGWGLKWDFIIVHESGHEWFANNITTKDIADMWVHESFTTYSETLFTEFYYGKQAANEYNYGQRRNIRNEENIIGIYGVNKEGSGDMYDKGSNMLHSIRHSINNDVKFRKMLRGMNAIFYHKTVTTQEIETYINKALQFNFQCVFNQYLRTTQIPVLEYYVDTKSNKLYYKYSNCIEGFNLPIWINVQKKNIQLKPTTNFSSLAIKDAATVLETMASVELYYYLKVKEVKF
ncbi:MAG: M1 family metallopeptidase [Chitinophagaceae bacterium]|jgi:aminopeptidase N